MPKRVMICQPMAGRSDEEIFDERCKVVEMLDSYGYEVANSLFCFDDDTLKRKRVKSIPLYYLAESLRVMSGCDAVYFCEGWENARGCQIEYAAAEAYGLDLILWYPAELWMNTQKED